MVYQSNEAKACESNVNEQSPAMNVDWRVASLHTYLAHRIRPNESPQPERPARREHTASDVLYRRKRVEAILTKVLDISAKIEEDLYRNDQ